MIRLRRHRVDVVPDGLSVGDLFVRVGRFAYDQIGRPTNPGVAEFADLLDERQIGDDLTDNDRRHVTAVALDRIMLAGDPVTELLWFAGRIESGGPQPLDDPPGCAATLRRITDLLR